MLAEKPGKKFLSQILRFMPVEALASYIVVKRLPIGLTQFLESVCITWRVALPRRQHDTPMGGREPLPARRCSFRRSIFRSHARPQNSTRTFASEGSSNEFQSSRLKFLFQGKHLGVRDLRKFCEFPVARAVHSCDKFFSA